MFKNEKIEEKGHQKREGAGAGTTSGGYGGDETDTYGSTGRSGNY